MADKRRVSAHTRAAGNSTRAHSGWVGAVHATRCNMVQYRQPIDAKSISSSKTLCNGWHLIPVIQAKDVSSRSHLHA